MTRDTETCGSPTPGPSSTWAQTWTGQAVDLLAPNPGTIRLLDIAWSLSRLPRFLGHTHGPDVYSVAQHSILCESLVPADTDPAVRLAVLLHDAHEAYTGDIPTPLKLALAELRRQWGTSVDPLRVVQGRLQDAIHAAFGLVWGCFFVDARKTIHNADLLALAIEKRDLMAPEPRPWAPLPDPAGHEPIVLLGDASHGPFARRVRELIREARLTPRPGALA